MNSLRNKFAIFLMLLLLVFLAQNAALSIQPEWKEICSIGVEEYTTETQRPDPAVMLMGFLGTKNEPHSDLFVTTSGTIFVSALWDVSGRSSGGHSFDGKNWSFQKWPVEAKKRTAEPVSSESLVKNAGKIRDALYRSFIGKVNMDELVSALDAMPEDLKEEGPFPFFSSEEGRSWDSLNRQEKEERAKEGLKEIARIIVRFPHYYWAEKGETVFGLTGFDLARQETAPLPNAIYDVFDRMNLPPQRFLDMELEGKKLILFHIRMSDVFRDRGDYFYAEFFSQGDKLILVGETRIWVFTEDGKYSISHDLPVLAKPRGNQVEPAFFSSGDKLYVFGPSKVDEHRALVYVNDISSLVRERK